MAAFHAEQRGNPTCRHRFLDIIGGQRELQRIGIARDQPLGHVDLLDGGLHRFGFGQVGADIDRPPLRPDLAQAQPREIRMHRFAAIARGIERIAEIEAIDHIAQPGTQLDGYVVVPVPDRRRFERGSGGAFGLVLRQRRGSEGESGSGGSEQEMAHEQEPLDVVCPVLAKRRGKERPQS